MLFYSILAYTCAFATATNMGNVQTFMTDYLKHEEENNGFEPSKTFAQLRESDKLRFLCVYCCLICLKQ